MHQFREHITELAVKVKWHTLLKLFWNMTPYSQKFTDVSGEGTTFSGSSKPSKVINKQSVANKRNTLPPSS